MKIPKKPWQWWKYEKWQTQVAVFGIVLFFVYGIFDFISDHFFN